MSLLSFLGCHMLPFCQIEKLYSDILVIFIALMWQIFNFYPMHVNNVKHSLISPINTPRKHNCSTWSVTIVKEQN